MHFTPAPRPPRNPNGAPESRWVLAKEEPTGQAASIGNVNYEKYAHPIAMPGPVLSAKTGKQYVPNLSDLGQKKQ